MTLAPDREVVVWWSNTVSTGLRAGAKDPSVKMSASSAQRKCSEFLGEGKVEIHPLRVWFRLRDRGDTWVKTSNLQWLRGCAERSYPNWGSVEGSGYCLVC